MRKRKSVLQRKTVKVLALPAIPKLLRACFKNRFGLR
jgi:hypothetical protein